MCMQYKAAFLQVCLSDMLLFAPDERMTVYNILCWRD